VIRAAVAADAAVITDLVERAYAAYVPRIGRRPAPMDADHAAEIARCESFVVGGESGLAGVIVLVNHAGYLEIENVAVDPRRQGAGLGKQLLEFALDTARERELGEVRLYTHELMTENIALYTRLGYREIDRRREQGFARVYFSRLVGE
jgi:ribosomal protein S18 acetylase RimI-like enzyme